LTDEPDYNGRWCFQRPFLVFEPTREIPVKPPVRRLFLSELVMLSIFIIPSQSPVESGPDKPSDEGVSAQSEDSAKHEKKADRRRADRKDGDE
jgi:hypothetical protein